MNHIISLNFNGLTINFNGEAFINATEVAKLFGKRPETYLKTEPTKRYIAALAKSLGVTPQSVTAQNQGLTNKNAVTPQSVTVENQLVMVIQGGMPAEQGTWFHPKLAIDFARWLSPEFAVWCDAQIEAILSGKPIEAKPEPEDYVVATEHLLKVLLIDHKWLLDAILLGDTDDDTKYWRAATLTAILQSAERTLSDPLPLGKIRVLGGADFSLLSHPV